MRACIEVGQIRKKDGKGGKEFKWPERRCASNEGLALQGWREGAVVSNP